MWASLLVVYITGNSSIPQSTRNSQVSMTIMPRLDLGNHSKSIYAMYLGYLRLWRWPRVKGARCLIHSYLVGSTACFSLQSLTLKSVQAIRACGEACEATPLPSDWWYLTSFQDLLRWRDESYIYEPAFPSSSTRADQTCRDPFASCQIASSVCTMVAGVSFVNELLFSVS